jgi:predicted metalloprotease
MKWDEGYESPDVEDRRGERPPMEGGGLGMLLPLFLRHGWKGGLLFAVLYFAGRYLLAPPPTQRAGHDDTRAFVGYVLDDIQKSWAERLPGYQRAHVVLYSDATATGCGRGDASVGPFYCPLDEKVYLDATFFQELHDRFGVQGDFAQAYVIAHEIGHHIQRLSGVTAQVQRAPLRAQKGEGHLSVRTELQADCLAGVWARSAQNRGVLEPGDIDSAMKAAAAIGDDRLQRQATGTVQPETWTHGSSEERVHWFSRGFQTGDPSACDTFHASSL